MAGKIGLDVAKPRLKGLGSGGRARQGQHTQFRFGGFSRLCALQIIATTTSMRFHIEKGRVVRLPFFKHRMQDRMFHAICSVARMIAVLI